MKDKSEIFKSVNINLDLDNRIESKTMNDLSEIHKNEVIHHDRTLEKILSIQYSNQEKNDSIKYICLKLDNEYLVTVEILSENQLILSLKIVKNI